MFELKQLSVINVHIHIHNIVERQHDLVDHHTPVVCHLFLLVVFEF